MFKKLLAKKQLQLPPPPPSVPVDELSILYQRARMEWDERLGGITAQLHVWRMIAILALCITAFAVIGLTYIGAQSKIEPYVFAMSDHSVLALQAAKSLSSEQKYQVEVSTLARFVENVRTIYTDANAQTDSLNNAYNHLQSGSAAHAQVTRYIQEHNPFKRAEKEIVKITVNSVLPINAKAGVYQVEWTENVEDRKGVPQGLPLRFKAAITIVYAVPATQKGFMLNPTGLWVNDFSVTERF